MLVLRSALAPVPRRGRLRFTYAPRPSVHSNAHSLSSGYAGATPWSQTPVGIPGARRARPNDHLAGVDTYTWSSEVLWHRWLVGGVAFCRRASSQRAFECPFAQLSVHGCRSPQTPRGTPGEGAHDPVTSWPVRTRSVGRQKFLDTGGWPGALRFADVPRSNVLSNALSLSSAFAGARPWPQTPATRRDEGALHARTHTRVRRL